MMYRSADSSGPAGLSEFGDFPPPDRGARKQVAVGAGIPGTLSSGDAGGDSAKLGRDDSFMPAARQASCADPGARTLHAWTCQRSLGRRRRQAESADPEAAKNHVLATILATFCEILSEPLARDARNLGQRASVS
jgi:hypothetical protein